MINNFLKENNLQNKVLNSYDDEDGECIWYIVSEHEIPSDEFLKELDKVLGWGDPDLSDKYYGSL